MRRPMTPRPRTLISTVSRIKGKPNIQSTDQGPKSKRKKVQTVWAMSIVNSFYRLLCLSKCFAYAQAPGVAILPLGNVSTKIDVILRAQFMEPGIRGDRRRFAVALPDRDKRVPN